MITEKTLRFISGFVMSHMHIPDHFDIKMPEEITFTKLVSWFSAGAMIFGGVFPFIPQYRDIKRTGNTDGFSTFVCLTLLIANILRIMFWCGKHFELPLLAQSYIMVFTMLCMVHLCVVSKRKSEILAPKQRKFSDSDPHHKNGHLSSSHPPHPQTGRHFLDLDITYFWKWTDFRSYLEFTALFTLTVGFWTYIMLNNTIYIEILGFLAVFAEAMLGAPQFYKNLQNKSTQGMSKKMVLMWTFGDVFKTCYFILREAPPQFWICGMIQVSIDISIFIQVFIYRNLSPLSVKSTVK